MARAMKLQIVNAANGINCNVRYENMKGRTEKPEITAKTTDGRIVKEKNVVNGQVIAYNKAWVTEDDGQVYQGEVKFFCGEDEVAKVEMTEVFDIERFEPLTNYTDKFVIEKFYELYPADNDKTKDIDRDIAVKTNLAQMRKLWDYLTANQVVGRGVFNVSSRGFVESNGYVRGISVDGNKWGLEIGVFKEMKIFQHLQENVAIEIPKAEPVGKKKKLSMI